jgi:hypothetical protein
MWRSALLLALLILPGCTPAPPPLQHTAGTPVALATSVLAAVSAGDRAALASLALSEQEFRDHIWPALPAARPERNLPFSYVWGDLHQKSEASLRSSLERHRGHTWSLVDVRLGEATVYDGYTVHRDAVFVVRAADGTTEDLRLCGSMVEQAGRWKVFSYVVND